VIRWSELTPSSATTPHRCCASRIVVVVRLDFPPMIQNFQDPMEILIFSTQRSHIN
jgi:hypothetical protein